MTQTSTSTSRSNRELSINPDHHGTRMQSNASRSSRLSSAHRAGCHAVHPSDSRYTPIRRSVHSQVLIRRLPRSRPTRTTDKRSPRQVHLGLKTVGGSSRSRRRTRCIPRHRCALRHVSCHSVTYPTIATRILPKRHVSHHSVTYPTTASRVHLILTYPTIASRIHHSVAYPTP